MTSMTPSRPLGESCRRGRQLLRSVEGANRRRDLRVPATPRKVREQLHVRPLRAQGRSCVANRLKTSWRGDGITGWIPTGAITARAGAPVSPARFSCRAAVVPGSKRGPAFSSTPAALPPEGPVVRVAWRDAPWGRATPSSELSNGSMLPTDLICVSLTKPFSIVADLVPCLLPREGGDTSSAPPPDSMAALTLTSVYFGGLLCVFSATNVPRIVVLPPLRLLPSWPWLDAPPPIYATAAGPVACHPHLDAPL
eukprot:CAMPEP_0117584980 /NCGR_PEP_ID=MMETSP0784-20121206/67896_1 /TAXON_ID=39447 /ORGANISM="" /LENGTH=252 /DNA_ID=CAMNT_0005385887 /DNA_START=242 /DNA_END=998 /DNA_ORIENTATION=-